MQNYKSKFKKELNHKVIEEYKDFNSSQLYIVLSNFVCGWDEFKKPNKLRWGVE